MKPIVIICGVNHSGTSLIASVLISNGGWIGEYNKSKNNKTNYIKYEDQEFKQCCLKGHFDEERFKRYLKKIPKNEVIIFKYPKSLPCIKRISEIIERPLKIIYTKRKKKDLIDSNLKRKGCDKSYIKKYISKMEKIIDQYDGDKKFAYFEKFKKKNKKHIREILKFCNLDINNINLNSIK